MLKQEMLAPGNTVLERFAAESRVPETSSVKLTQVQRYVAERETASSMPT